MSVPDKIETVKRKSAKLIRAVDEILQESKDILGESEEERQLTREAFKGKTPAQLREAVKYWEARA